MGIHAQLSMREVIFLHTFFLQCCKIEAIETIHNTV
jgi:hypothetical protein